MSNLSPLEIRILLACYYSPDPENEFSGGQWESSAAVQARQRFTREDILRPDLTLTDRGMALKEKLCSIPFPTAHWVFEDGNEP